MSVSQHHARVFSPAKHAGFPSQQQSLALICVYKATYQRQGWIQTVSIGGVGE